MSPASPNKLRVLFVDDEAPIREVMGNELPRMGHHVTVCEDGYKALEVLEKQHFEAAIVDLRMPGLSGWDVVDHIKKVSPDTEIVISTGHGSMEEAIQAIRKGAYDFIPKPCKLVAIANVLRRIADKRTLTNKNIALEGRLRAVEGTTQLVGETPGMARVKALIEKVAPTDSAVMILGETGTGKELVARRIHEQSKRAHMPFVAVNCGAIPDHLVESEFFGHKKGAFTGAEVARKGLFEVANGGTLFLDELGELDKAMQVTMLRFLESGEIRRVGENEAINVDVRIVCATHRNLQDMVHEGRFREDLFFRVNTFEIRLPPLRDRKADIPALARCLVSRHLKRPDLGSAVLTTEALAALQSHEWTGNVRELANALEHAVILAEGGPILPEHLPTSVTNHTASTGGGGGAFWLSSKAKSLRQIEMEVIYHVLDKHNGDKPKTANELGIALKTLYNKLNQYEAQSAA